MARGNPRRAPEETVASSRGGEPMSIETFGDPTPLESVSYILAMTKPLVEIAKARNLPSLVYFLEMAVLDAADLELKLRRSNCGLSGKPSDPEDEE